MQHATGPRAVLLLVFRFPLTFPPQPRPELLLLLIEVLTILVVALLLIIISLLAFLPGPPLQESLEGNCFPLRVALPLSQHEGKRNKHVRDSPPNPRAVRSMRTAIYTNRMGEGPSYLLVFLARFCSRRLALGLPSPPLSLQPLPSVVLLLFLLVLCRLPLVQPHQVQLHLAIILLHQSHHSEGSCQ